MIEEVLQKEVDTRLRALKARTNAIYGKELEYLLESITMFDIDKNKLHGVGLYWFDDDDTCYGNKEVDGEITDWYELGAGDGTNRVMYCYEIDKESGKRLCEYLIDYTALTSTKVDMDGKLLQQNYYVDEDHIETIDPMFMLQLQEIQFPWLDRIKFYGSKPYGRIVEVFVPTPDMEKIDENVM